MIDLDMGKYGFYVWGSYALTAISLIGIVALSVMTHQKMKRQLKALNAAKPE
jgi:heme exporter protein CcmD